MLRVCVSALNQCSRVHNTHRIENNCECDDVSLIILADRKVEHTCNDFKIKKDKKKFERRTVEIEKERRLTEREMEKREAKNPENGTGEW